MTHTATESPAPNFIELLREFFLPGQRRFTLILLYTVFAVCAWKAIPAAPRLVVPEDGKHVLQRMDAGTEISAAARFGEMFRHSQKLLGAMVLFGLIPAGIVKCVFREKLADFGLQTGILKYTVRSFCVLAPVMLALGYLSGGVSAFYAVYPYDPWLLGGHETFSAGWIFFVGYAALYWFAYYLSWEFFFRGFILRGLIPSMGVACAILVQTLASTLAHLGHPMTEVFGAIGGGIYWGMLALRTRSIVSGWMQHALLGISLDVFLLLTAMK